MKKFSSLLVVMILHLSISTHGAEATKNNTNLEVIVSGQISDWQKNPVSGVTVTLTGKDKNLLAEYTTDEKGRYEGVVPEGDFPIKMSVSKNGWGSFSTTWEGPHLLKEPNFVNHTIRQNLPPYFTMKLRQMEGEELQSAVVEMLTSSDWYKDDLKRELFKMEEHLRVPMNQARQNSDLRNLANDWLVFVGELEGDNASLFKNMMAPPRVIENVDLATCIQDAGLMIIEKKTPEYEFRIDHVVFNKTLTKTFVQCAAYGGPKRGSGYDLCFTKINGKWILTAYKHTWKS